MRVVALLGLGMDPRAVRNLSALAPIEVHHHIEHQKDESLHDYAIRWGRHLQLKSTDIVLGMSFAGPMALEMAHHFQLKGCILVSTFTGSKELPISHRRALRLGLHRWIPYRFGWWVGKRWARRNQILGQDNAEAIRAIERRTDPQFYRWVIDALGKWHGTVPYHPCLRIHGDHDRILPLKQGAPNVEIVKGNHFLLTTAEGRSAISQKVDTFIRRLAS